MESDVSVASVSFVTLVSVPVCTPHQGWGKDEADGMKKVVPPPTVVVLLGPLSLSFIAPDEPGVGGLINNCLPEFEYLPRVSGVSSFNLSHRFSISDVRSPWLTLT